MASRGVQNPAGSQFYVFPLGSDTADAPPACRLLGGSGGPPVVHSDADLGRLGDEHGLEAGAVDVEAGVVFREGLAAYFPTRPPDRVSPVREEPRLLYGLEYAELVEQLLSGRRDRLRERCCRGCDRAHESDAVAPPREERRRGAAGGPAAEDHDLVLSNVLHSRFPYYRTDAITTSSKAR